MIVVVPYDQQWPHQFAKLGGRLREVLGEVALRIDHIGSTAVAGLAASLSSSRCCSATTCGPTPRTWPLTPSSSAAWPSNSRTTAGRTPTRRCPSHGRSSGVRTTGRSRPGGNPGRATPETVRAVTTKPPVPAVSPARGPGSCPRPSPDGAPYAVPATPIRCPSGSVKWPTTKGEPGARSGPIVRVPPRLSALLSAASTSGTPM
jgi:GrpB protein